LGVIYRRRASADIRPPQSGRGAIIEKSALGQKPEQLGLSTTSLLLLYKLLLDGSDDYSVMPVTVGDQPHGYHWMPYRVGQGRRTRRRVRRVMIGFAILQVFRILLFFPEKEGRK